MPPMPCANAPSAAKFFVQLCTRRSNASSLPTISGSSSILDVLLPPRTQARALSLSLGAAARNNNNNTSRTIITSSTTTSRFGVNTNVGVGVRRHAGESMSMRTFSTSQPLARTVAIHNPQTDEEGNEMMLEITPRAANVCVPFFISRAA